ncbi:MAG: hypothetical protein AAGA85_04730, partial [Bacteroidota bacterium]
MYKNRSLTFVALYLLILGTSFAQTNEEDDPIQRSRLQDPCCTMPVEFKSPGGTETIQTGSTSKDLILKANITGDNCVAQWSYRNICEPENQWTAIAEEDETIVQLHRPQQWGNVIYQSQVVCDDNNDCNNTARLPVVDWGFWFFDEDGNLRRFNAPGELPEEFYDLDRPTVVFIHGLRRGATELEIRQDLTLKTKRKNESGGTVTDPETNQPILDEEFLPKLWMDRGYNFAIFNWTQLADMGVPQAVESKLWLSDVVTWKKPDGQLTDDHIPEDKTMVQLMLEQYDLWDPSENLRIIGHGLGSQLALEMANHIRKKNRASSIDKVVLLNGWWSEGMAKFKIDAEIEEQQAEIDRDPEAANRYSEEEQEEGIPAFERSRRVARRLYEGEVQVAIEGYRNLFFDRNEFPEDDVPDWMGSDNDGIKEFSAHTNMQMEWLNDIVVETRVNEELFGEDANRRHEAMYLWYLKSIDYDTRGKIVSSVRPTINGASFDASQCTWEEDVTLGLNATTLAFVTKALQDDGYFFTQFEGEDTPESDDDRFVQENFCICELKREDDPSKRGLVYFHDLAMREYANCNDFAIFLRTPEPNTPTYVNAMYSSSSTEKYFPSPIYKMPILKEGEGDGCGEKSEFNGIATINPNIDRARGLIKSSIESSFATNDLATAYRDFVFDSLKSKALYVYPMESFAAERWNETHSQALINNKLTKGWNIIDDPCYVVKDSLSQLIYGRYRLHGAYNEDDGTAWPQQGIQIRDLNNEINRLTNVYATFNINQFSDPLERRRYQMIQQDFTHDGWKHRNDWYRAGPEMGPQANLTVFMPNGLAYLLGEKDVEGQKKMYECMGIDWQTLYPDEKDEEKEPNKVVYYKPTEEEIADDDLNLGGYPALHDPNAEAPILAGRPTLGQQQYEDENGVTGFYNYIGRARADRQPLIDWVNNNASAFNAQMSEYPVGALFGIPDAVANDVGMHPHHYLRMGEFAADFKVTMLNRNSNPDAVQWISAMYQGGPYRPKPFLIKGKSIKRGSYQDLPLTMHDDSEATFASGLTGSTSAFRLIGPGMATGDDNSAQVLDIDCEQRAGLASFDPRTVRGRGVVDPPRKFDNISINEDQTIFEVKYAEALQKKLLKSAYYVFPLPFFANKYQHFFRFCNITDLDDGWVEASIAEENITHTDQFAREIRVRLMHGGQPLQFFPEQNMFGYNDTPLWTTEFLDETVMTMFTTDPTVF